MPEPGLAHRDERRVDRLVGAPLRPERDARRRRDEEEARVLVTGIIQRIEAAGDERIIDRADREEPRAEEVAREPERRQHQEQIVLRDAELDMLPGRAAAPFLGRGYLRGGKQIGELLPSKQTSLVHERAEIGRYGDVGRGRHDPVGERAAGLGEIEQDAAERGLGRLLITARHRDRGHLGDMPGPRRFLAGDPRPIGERPRRLRAVAAEPRPGRPFLALGDPHGIAKRGDLAGVHQPGMIVLVAGEGEAEALDRIGDEQSRHVVLRLIERVGQRFQAMAAEIGHQRGERIVVARVEDRLHRLAEILFEPRPPGRPAEIGQHRIIGVARLVDPALQRRAAFLAEGGLLRLAIFQRHDPPAAARENLVEAAEHPVRRRRVEALAVIVDDPPAIADIVLGRLDQAFVDIALVKLGIAHQRDHPPGIGRLHQAVGDAIILDEACEGGDRHAEPDRAGREIDGDPILRPARIALHPAEAAKRLHRLAGLRAEQIVDGVEHRPGMGLHRDLVVRPERVEIERRHDRGHRRAGGLVPADLQPVDILADMIGVVDGPRRQPAQAIVDQLQRRDIGALGLLQHGLALAPFGAPA